VCQCISVFVTDSDNFTQKHLKAKIKLAINLFCIEARFMLLFNVLLNARKGNKFTASASCFYGIYSW